MKIENWKLTFKKQTGIELWRRERDSMQKTVIVKGSINDKFNKGSVADKVNEVLNSNRAYKLEAAVPIAANNIDSTLLLVLEERGAASAQLKA